VICKTCLALWSLSVTWSIAFFGFSISIPTTKQQYPGCVYRRYEAEKVGFLLVDKYEGIIMAVIRREGIVCVKRGEMLIFKSLFGVFLSISQAVVINSSFMYG